MTSSSDDGAVARKRLSEYVARFSPEIAKLAASALATMRKRLPGAVEMVYDNAYALVVGFSPDERPSSALFSIAIYPKKVSLCFLYGARLSDPNGLLAGGGNQVRHVRLENERTLDRPEVKAMMKAAVAWAGDPYDAGAQPRTIVRAVSANRRPRR
jgi:hypothetical protein